MDKTLKLLKKARARIANEKNWCKNESKQYALIKGKRVVQFCMLGSIQPSPTGSSRDVYESARAVLADAIYKLSRGRTDHITGWNDSPRRTHAQVLKAFDIAIAAREEK